MSLVITEKSGAIANLKLNRPEKLNALSNNLRGEVKSSMPLMATCLTNSSQHSIPRSRMMIFAYLF